MKVGKCRLCLQEKALLRKSHIIPDFMYNGVFDEKHRLIPTEVDANTRRIRKGKPVQTGEFEGGILCNECDNNVLGGYEDYASKTLYGGIFSGNAPIFENFTQEKDGIIFTQCRNLDYRRFKLFLLSILWRSSICTRPFFDKVSIGPHEEMIRRMLLEGNAGSPDAYPIALFTFLRDKIVPFDFVENPVQCNSNGCIYFHFTIAGMIYLFYVETVNRSFPPRVLQNTIVTSGEMKVGNVPPEYAYKMYLDPTLPRQRYSGSMIWCNDITF